MFQCPHSSDTAFRFIVCHRSCGSKLFNPLSDGVVIINVSISLSVKIVSEYALCFYHRVIIFLKASLQQMHSAQLTNDPRLLKWHLNTTYIALSLSFSQVCQSTMKIKMNKCCSTLKISFSICAHAIVHPSTVCVLLQSINNIQHKGDLRDVTKFLTILATVRLL